MNVNALTDSLPICPPLSNPSNYLRIEDESFDTLFKDEQKKSNIPSPQPYLKWHKIFQRGVKLVSSWNCLQLPKSLTISKDSTKNLGNYIFTILKSNMHCYS